MHRLDRLREARAYATLEGVSIYEDERTGERFARVVGQRRQAPVGKPPMREALLAMSEMAKYRTRAPKGVYRYASHDEANVDRERWQIERMVTVAKRRTSDR